MPNHTEGILGLRTPRPEIVIPIAVAVDADLATSLAARPSRTQAAIDPGRRSTPTSTRRALQHRQNRRDPLLARYITIFQTHRMAHRAAPLENGLFRSELERAIVYFGNRDVKAQTRVVTVGNYLILGLCPASDVGLHPDYYLTSGDAWALPARGGFTARTYPEKWRRNWRRRNVRPNRRDARAVKAWRDQQREAWKKAFPLDRPLTREEIGRYTDDAYGLLFRGHWACTLPVDAAEAREMKAEGLAAGLVAVLESGGITRGFSNFSHFVNWLRKVGARGVREIRRHGDIALDEADPDGGRRMEWIADGEQPVVLLDSVRLKGTALRYQSFYCPASGHLVKFAQRFCSTCKMHLPEGLLVDLPSETRTALWEGLLSRREDRVPHADGLKKWEQSVEDEERLHAAINNELPEHEEFLEGTIPYEYTLPSTARLTAAPKPTFTEAETEAEKQARRERVQGASVKRWLDDMTLKHALKIAPSVKSTALDDDVDPDDLAVTLPAPVHRRPRPVHYWPEFLHDDYVLAPRRAQRRSSAPTEQEQDEAAADRRAERLERAEAVIQKMNVGIALQIATLNWLTKQFDVGGRGWKSDAIVPAARKAERRQFNKWVQSVFVVPPDPADLYRPMTSETRRGSAKLQREMERVEAMLAAYEYVRASIRRLRPTEAAIANDSVKELTHFQTTP
jgi:hypothetical protein